MAEQGFGRFALTAMDKSPFYAMPCPMSYIPNADPSWDDGYDVLAYDTDSGVQVWGGMRVAPNSTITGHSIA